MRNWIDLKNHLPKIQEKLGICFANPDLLALAFVHRSYVNEDKSIGDHNERLEFLGDSILGLIVAEYLYRLLPKTAEGDLSYLRSRLVEANSCMLYIQKLQLSHFLLLGKGERMNDGRGRESILADLFEAIMGAIFLDRGLAACKHFFIHHFEKEILEVIQTPICNWKALLQDFCQKKYQCPPVYRVIAETGPDHSKEFLVVVLVEGLEMGRGVGASKKEAQQAAASVAFSKIEKGSL